MLKSLEAIALYREGVQDHLEDNLWLKLIVQAEEQIVNLERVESLEELDRRNPVLDYVERSLQILDQLPRSIWIKELVEETLIWSETAKGGTAKERLVWQEEGINCFVHNLGSAQLYERYLGRAVSEKGAMIQRLIETHGLIGQQIRGEVPPEVNKPLHDIVEDQLLTAEELERLLTVLNHCIIGAVSPELWQNVQHEVKQLIELISSGNLASPMPMKERLRRMRLGPISRGEDFTTEWAKLTQEGFHAERLESLSKITFWYVESALQTFSLEQFLKVMVLAAQRAQNEFLSHISFEHVMNSIYYDYKGVKKTNIYKKRIIEKYLAELTWKDIEQGSLPAENPHLLLRQYSKEHLPGTVFFQFQFSAAAEKLIEFCMEAEKSPLYERAVLLLFDLFELRRDAFDRFHNEDTYLSQMNNTADYKAVILEHVTGQKVLDIGPGGGVLLDLLEERMPEVTPIGIDISSNVVEALRQRKQREGRQWEVLQGDALNLKDFVEAGTVDTVIFSSILHELYSYVPLNGNKFNHDTVSAALRSAFDVLSAGGVIIIRDGIMTEPASLLRRVRFLEEDGLVWLERYAKDFAGRQIQFQRLGNKKCSCPLMMPWNFYIRIPGGKRLIFMKSKNNLVISPLRSLPHLLNRF